jgi:hypothetical protein
VPSRATVPTPNRAQGGRLTAAWRTLEAEASLTTSRPTALLESVAARAFAQHEWCPRRQGTT